MPSELTTKQQRDARRAEKVALLKRQQAAQKRKRIIGFSIGGVAILAVIALVVGVIVANSTPKADPSAISIKGLKTFSNLTAVHVADGTTVDYAKDYGMDPPAGGNHWGVWLNCGVYNQPQQNERAVHDLEHGAVWVTYDPDKLSDAQVTALVAKLPKTYITVSPYPGLPTAVVASAWGKQVQLTGVNDSRLGKFIDKFWRAADAPEPTSPCTGGIDGPGKVS
jgi:hypothetical protein